MNTKPHYIIGSISSATLRPEDLIPRFLDALEELDGPRCAAVRNEFAEELESLGSDELTDEQQESLDYLLNEALFSILDEYAPPYFYFGAHEGDGADFGFWLSQNWLDDFDGLRVSDTSEVPADYSGEVLHVNDHGNATLYAAQDGKLNEVWSIV